MCALSAKEDDLCIVCETIVQYVEAMLDDKTSVDEIEKLLKKICNFLPGSMTAQVRLVTNTLCIVFSILINTRLSHAAKCWRRGSVVRMSVCSWRTFPDLRLIHG